MMTATATATPAPTSRKTLWRKVAGGLAIAFGIATLIEGGKVLFGDTAAVAEAGNVVSFVLVFNFAAGFLYLMTGVGTIARHSPALWFARILALGSAGVLVAFFIHIASDGLYESRTLVAMSVRTAFWVAMALVLPRLFADGTPGKCCRH